MTSQEARGATRPTGFRRAVMLTGSGSAASIVLLFLETAVAVRLLEPADYGVYVLLIVAANFLIMVIDFGSRTAVTQLLARSEPQDQPLLVSTTLLFRLSAVAVVAVFVVLVAQGLAIVDPTHVLLPYATLLPFMVAFASLDELLLGMLQGLQAYKHMAAAQVLRSSLRLGLSVLFVAVMGTGMVGLVYSWILSFAISVTYQYFVLPTEKRLTFVQPLLAQLVRFGLPLQGSRFLWFVFLQVNPMLLGALAGPVAVAYYSVAARIPDAIQRLSESFIAVYFPTMTSLLAKGSHGQASRMFNNSLRLASFVVALGALTAVVFSDPIITIFFSDTYAESARAFALLMIALHMTFMVNLMGYTLTSAGHPERSLGENITRASINIIGNLLFIPLFGFTGAVYATLAACYTANPVAAWLLRRSGIPVQAGSYVKQTLLLLICAGIYWQWQPEAILFKLAIIALFVGLNLVLVTVTRADAALLLPRRMTERMGLAKDSVAPGN